jgi:murein DD-endopeptidase MepM/ murein hydrolase activator NlpD
MGLNRHCFDIIGSNEIGKPYSGSGTTVSDWYGFGVPVYSPVAGKVIHSEDGHQDDPINPPTRADGNWVAIRSADNKIFNFYHLKKNSIKVRVGDSVALGQQIGGLGNSSSTIPHLHFGVYSGDWMVTYPVQFTNYTLYKNNGKTFIRSGTPGANDREDHVAVE